MKKQLTALLIFALLLTMAGCSAAKAAQKLDTMEDQIEANLDAAEERIERKMDAAENKLEDHLRNTVSPAPAASPTHPAAPAEVPPAVPESPQMLTEEQARQIALDYLSITANQVTWQHTEYEIDDGIPQFDITLHQGDWEYEFEIHAENGHILSYDKDHKYD